MDTPLALTLFLVLAALNFGGMIALTTLLGPRRPNPVKSEPFEFGSVPKTPLPGRVNVRFNRVAMLFIIFDIETVLMYPWATIYRSTPGSFLLVEMAIFIAVLGFGLAYVWRQGGLEWD